MDEICLEGYVPEFGHVPIHTIVIVPIAQYILQNFHIRKFFIDYNDKNFILKKEK
jgi:hypothetical protein